MFILGIIIGYFIGMMSCLWQVMTMERQHKEKIEEILKKRK